MVVEDYDELRETICDYLSDDGHELYGVPMAEDVDDTPVGYLPDLYILDVNLPGEDGTSLAKRIRCAQPNAGIVIVSARCTLENRIEGYSSGANIYLTKPISLSELRSVVAGFAQRLATAEKTLSTQLDLRAISMTVCGSVGPVRLTQSEVVLLGAFARAARQTLERWQVAAHLGNGEDLTTENLEVKLSRLRKKLISCGTDTPAIQSIRGVGYRLCVPVQILSE